MSITDKINDLLKQGCTRVVFGVNQNGQPLVSAEQMIATDSGQSQIAHQCLGPSFADALESVTKAVTHCSEMQSKILRVN